MPPIDSHVLDALADAVVAADGEGRITYANPGITPLLGWRPEELIGRPLTTLQPARMHEVHRAGFRRYRETRIPHIIGRPIRVPALHRDGYEVDIELTLSARVVDGRDLYVASLRDIRNRVDLEQLLDLTKILRAEARAAARLAARLDLDHVLRTAVQTLVEDFDGALAHAWIVDPDDGSLVLGAEAQSPAVERPAGPDRLDPATDATAVGHAARTRAPFISLAAERDERLDLAWIRRAGIRAAMAHPLLVGDALAGVIAVYFRRPVFAEVSEILTTFARMISSSLRDVELFTREQAARARAEAAERRLRLQVDTIGLLARGHALEDVGVELLKRVTEGLGYEVGALWQHHPEDGRLHPREVWLASHLQEDVVRAAVTAVRLAAGEGIVGDVWVDGRPRREGDVASKAAFRRRPLVVAAGLRGGLWVPVRTPAGTAAVLELLSTAPTVASDEMIETATALAAQLGAYLDRLAIARALQIEEDRRRYVAEAGAILAGSLEYETTLAAVARLAIPRLADWCAVDLLEGDELRNITVAHKDPECVALAQELRRRYPPLPDDAHGVYAAIRTGRPRLRPRITHERLRAISRSPDELALLEQLALRSALIVPLIARGRVLGAITYFYSASSDRDYGAEDLAMAEELARRAASAIDHALLYRSERSARRQAEAAELRFRELVHGLDGAIVWEAEQDSLVPTFVSARAVELLGYPLELWLREPRFWAHRLPPEERSRVLTAFRRILREGGHTKLEHRMRASDGRLLWFQTSVRAIDEGDRRTLRGLSVDITRRKEAEETIRSYAREQAAIAALGQRAMTTRSIDQLLSAACATVAQTLDAAIAVLLELVPGRGRLVVRTGWGGAAGLAGTDVPLDESSLAASALLAGHPVLTDSPRTLELLRASSLRLEREAAGAAYVVIRGAGGPVGVLGVLTTEDRQFVREHVQFLDVIGNFLGVALERHASESALRASEDRFRTIVEGIDDYAIFMLDPDGRFEHLSTGAERILGWREEELVGRSFDLLFSPEERAGGAAARELEVARRDGNFHGEGVRVRKDGSRFWSEVTLTALRDEEGRVRGFAKVSHDISERRRAEEERARLLHEAQEAIRVRDEFLSIASHELKTPLTSLQLQIEGLLRSAQRPGGLAPERVLPKLTSADRQIERLGKLVNELLDVGRITGGRLQLELEDVDLAGVVREVAGRFAEESARAGSPIELHIQEPIVGHWDRLRVEQVVTNLVSNAVKYGAGRPVSVWLSSREGIARLVVEDRGIGIAPEHASRIFARFERAVSVRSYGGLGLGLYIVKQSIDALGGRVRVTSVPGRGSVFTVELPEAGPSQARGAIETAPEGAPGAPP